MGPVGLLRVVVVLLVFVLGHGLLLVLRAVATRIHSGAECFRHIVVSIVPTAVLAVLMLMLLLKLHLVHPVLLLLLVLLLVLLVLLVLLLFVLVMVLLLLLVLVPVWHHLL